MPKTCNIYRLKGATESGSYIIDPDGPGNAPPFTAYCDFATGNLLEQDFWSHISQYQMLLQIYLMLGIFKLLGSTVVSHDLVDDVSIPVCEGKNCFTRRLTYQTAMTQLDALTNISTYCFQEIKVYS